MITPKPSTKKIQTEVCASLSIIQYIIQHPGELEKPGNRAMMERHINSALDYIFELEE